VKVEEGRVSKYKAESGDKICFVVAQKLVTFQCLSKSEQ
jgi:hypothetical protein